MRLSRMIPTLFLLGVMLAGASMLCAGEWLEFNTPKGKFLVELNDYKEIIKGVTPQGEELAPRDISELGFVEKNDTQNIFYELKEFPAGAFVVTGPGDTCFWYFDGRQWIQYCYGP